MPFIHFQTTKEVSADLEKEITKDLGKVIADLPGKTERWLMIRVDGDCRMTFAGTPGDCCMVAISVFGTCDRKYYDKLTKDVTDLVATKVGIPPERIYVRYGEYDKWGFAGENF